MELVTCECGDVFPADDAIVDLQGCILCPECSAASHTPCDICGEPAATVHPLDGTNFENYLHDPVRGIYRGMGTEAYVATCHRCDNPTGVMR